MNRSYAPILQVGAAGLVAGVIAGIRWVLVLVSSDGPRTYLSEISANKIVISIISLICVLVFSSAWRSINTGSNSSLHALISILLGSILYAVLAAVSRAAVIIWAQSVIWLPLAGCCIGLLFSLSKSHHWTIPVVLAGLAFIPGFDQISLLSGDHLSQLAASYGPPPTYGYYLPLSLSLVLLACWSAWSYAVLRRVSALQMTIRGAVVGLMLSAIIAIAQTCVMFVAMRTGSDPLYIILTFALILGVFSIAIAVSIAAWRSPASMLIQKFAPLPIGLIIIAFLFGAVYGYSDYSDLRSIYPDTMYAYIHFGVDGTWRRTLDQSSSSVRTWRAEDFLLSYPYSAYRPAAMLALAQSEFEEWRFDDASQTLERLKEEYLLLDGYCDILHALADVAGGKPAGILYTAPSDSYFSTWRQTQGAQMAAVSATRLGLSHRACGFHNLYINYLQGRQSTSWTADSVLYSQRQIDNILLRSDNGQSSSYKGTVILHVLSQSGPVRGARVILVKPHPDAALPTDSKQFTGAWSLPAWNGIWCLTDKDGKAILRNVPYDNYELVLGLNFLTSAHNCVVSSALPGIKVDTPITEVKPIHLMPAVELISPAANSHISSPVSLAWKPYPGAFNYSVSIIELSDIRPANPYEHQAPTGTTCWARSRIPVTSIQIQPDYFLNGHKGLQRGRSYMWIVYAYGSNGRLVSSSEHYFELKEQTFTVD